MSNLDKLEDVFQENNLFFAVPPDAVDFGYENGVVINFGNELPIGMVRDAPSKVDFPCDSASFYSICLFNVESDFICWMLVNAIGGKVSEAQVWLKYQMISIDAKCFGHYVFLVFKQHFGKLTYAKRSFNRSFQFQYFALESDFGDPIAVNYFQIGPFTPEVFPPNRHYDANGSLSRLRRRLSIQSFTSTNENDASSTATTNSDLITPRDQIILNKFTSSESTADTSSSSTASQHPKEKSRIQWLNSPELQEVIESLIGRPDLAKIDDVREAWHRSSLLHDVDSMQKLIDQFSDEFINDKPDEKRDWTELHKAAFYGHEEAVSLLLELGVNADAYTFEKGFTPLHLAVQNGHSKIAQILLDFGAEINAQGDEQYTALHWAAENQNYEIFTLLLDNGADVHLESMYGCLALHLTAARMTSCDLEKMVQKGANLRAVDEFGCNVLHFAAMFNDNPFVCQWIVGEWPESLLATDSIGFTALHIAIERHNVTAVRAMIDAGADPELLIHGDIGMSALEWARNLNRRDSIKIITKKP